MVASASAFPWNRMPGVWKGSSATTWQIRAKVYRAAFSLAPALACRSGVKLGATIDGPQAPSCGPSVLPPPIGGLAYAEALQRDGPSGARAVAPHCGQIGRAHV